jgi:glucodextranase-like protein
VDGRSSTGGGKGVRRKEAPQILLDWATISYRSILRTVVLVVLAGALGGLFFFLKASLRGSPEELALLDIGRAERLQREAATAAAGDPARGPLADRAGRLLTDARLAFDREAFPEARAAAQQSQAFSEKVLEGQGVETFAARIFKYEGDVKVKRSREFVWESLSGNTALKVGDQIKTASSGSAQVIYFDGTITTIKPGSLLEIRELSEDPATKVRRVQEKVNWGGVSASTSGGNVAGSVHEVATESATTRSFSRAQFEVDYNAESRATRTEVHSGTTEVRTEGATHTLKPLERIDVTAGRGVTRTTLPPAPALLDPMDSRVFLATNGTPDVSLRWAPVVPAGRYRLQLSRSSLFSALVLDKPDVHSSSVRIPGLPEGTYYWRVAALKDGGVEGAFSEIRRFKVAGKRDVNRDDRTPPALELSQFLPSGHLVIINGRTEPGTLLTVEGQSIDVYDDGTFNAVIRMKREGKNDIEIVAQDSSGNETRQRRSVYVDTY